MRAAIDGSSARTASSVPPTDRSARCRTFVDGGHHATAPVVALPTTSRDACTEHHGLLDGRVVCRRIHDVQRPAETGAGFLRNREWSGEVVPPPHERGGHGDASQHVGIERGTERSQHRMQRRLHRRRACEIDIVVGERGPRVAHPPSQAIDIERAVLPQLVVGLGVRLREDASMAAPNSGPARTAQAERVDQDQRLSRVGSALANVALVTERLADKHRGNGHGHRSTRRAMT